MGNISDYIAWRGDIPFSVSPFNHIDSLVLCQILYAQLDTIVSSKFTSTIQLSKVAKQYFNFNLHTADLGALINNQTVNFLKDVGNSRRFSTVSICGFKNIICTEQEIQFAAVCALLPTRELCIIFRGTDDTLVGWKEDFNMSHTCPVPSQIAALEYIEDACAKHKRKTLVMGHSKGGNLAVYASAFCNPKNSKRIERVFDNDGPGFLPNICEQKVFIENSKRVNTVIPESSIVGILLKRPNKPLYVKSSESSGIAQHDIFTWQLIGTDFISVKSQNIAGKLAAKTVDTWLDSVEPTARKEFIDNLFAVLASTKATTLLELSNNWVHCSVIVLKEMNHLDKQTKDQIYKIVMHLFHALQVNLPSLKDFFAHEKTKISSK